MCLYNLKGMRVTGLTNRQELPIFYGQKIR